MDIVVSSLQGETVWLLLRSSGSYTEKMVLKYPSVMDCTFIVQVSYERASS